MNSRRKTKKIVEYRDTCNRKKDLKPRYCFVEEFPKGKHFYVKSLQDLSDILRDALEALRKMHRVCPHDKYFDINHFHAMKDLKRLFKILIILGKL